MSLFKTRDWWSIHCGNGDEEFDQGCLCVGNVDNASDGFAKIVVGSYSGVLRIFTPWEPTLDDNGGSSATADSLLLETQLSSPILQVEIGRFVSSSANLHLIVLHPRKLSVYCVSAVSGNVELGNHYHLGLMFEHKLQRSAFRLVTGPFGKVEGRDFMCVLSVDGTVSLFEQESFSFSRFLPGALLPGPLAYVGHTDSFVTVSSSLLLESYKYQVLAVASAMDKNEDENVKTGKKVLMDWSYNLGEAALDITVIHPRNHPTLIYVLGERHLFCLKDNGALKFVKKLEYSPSCFHGYIHGSESTIFLLVANHSRMLMVYQDVCLKWASQVDAVPIAIQRANIRGLQGAIVTLSDDGRLTCSYLGTNPSVFTPPAVESREINYKETDKELAELYKIIQASQKSGASVTKQSDALLFVTVTVPKELNMISSNAENGEQMIPCITLKVQLRAILPSDNVQMMCHFEKSLCVSPPVIHFPTISDTVQTSASIQLKEGYVPSSLSGSITVLYTSALGSPSIVHTIVRCPLSLVVKCCQPLKDGDFKITIGCSKPTVKLDDLFPEFSDLNIKGSGQAAGFQFHYGGPTVTILVAKTSHRYRLQSDCFGAISLLVDELQSRLQTWYSKNSKLEEDELVCIYSNPLPLAEFFFVLNGHLQDRLRSLALEKRLAQLTAQFRAIQKRLLTKFKDKTTCPIANLNTLLESTYRQIIETSQLIESHGKQLDQSLCILNSAARFLCLLIKLYANVKRAEYELLKAALCPPLEQETEQGWEEVVANNVCYLLEATFSTPGQEPLSRAEQFGIPDNIGFLKKCITMLVDRLTKGMLVEETNETFDGDELGDDKSNAGVIVEKGGQQHLEYGVPLGSTFGKKKAVRFSHSEQNIQMEKTKLAEMKCLSFDDSNKVPQREEEGSVDNLADIHTLSYDTNSLQGEF